MICGMYSGQIPLQRGGLSMAQKDFVTVSESGVVVEVAGDTQQ